MGSKQFSSKCGNGHKNLSKSLNTNTINDYTLEDIKSYKIIGIQFGTNPLVDSLVIGENNNNNQNDKNYKAPPVIGFHQGFPGVLADIVGIGKNNCVHCFGFLEAEELKNKDEGIIIEFGEYEFGNPNDFEVKTLYECRKGGLRYYVVKKSGLKIIVV